MKKIISLASVVILALGLSVSTYAIEPVDEILPAGQFTMEQCEKYGVVPLGHNVLFEGWCVENGTYRVIPEKEPEDDYGEGVIPCIQTFDAEGRFLGCAIYGTPFELIYIDESVSEVVLTNCTMEYVSKENGILLDWVEMPANYEVKGEFD